MKATMKAGALVSTVKQTGQGLVLLCLLALLGLTGAGMSHASLASAPTGVRIAATEGDIRIGSVTAPAPDTTNGNVHIGG